MRVGLGSGSTAAAFVAALGQRIRDEGLSVTGVATSRATEQAAVSAGVPLVEGFPELDLAVDGADEFDPQGRMIKGGGGALLREKIVLAASGYRLIVTDPSKRVAQLGAFALPVEVFAWGVPYAERALRRLCPEARLRGTLSDNGQPIFDLPLRRIENPEALAAELDRMPGVAAHGLFLEHADEILCGGETVFRR